ncbi:MAG: hypothetical protein DHS80DRAFT_25968 [Piptocephalis tieghemiana]|nr:MAG: hypothetical protein DHS80DRAFT_25968 [Piptocephalis tieghemiana]
MPSYSVMVKLYLFEESADGVGHHTSPLSCYIILPDQPKRVFSSCLLSNLENHQLGLSPRIKEREARLLLLTLDQRPSTCSFIPASSGNFRNLSSFPSLLSLHFKHPVYDMTSPKGEEADKNWSRRRIQELRERRKQRLDSLKAPSMDSVSPTEADAGRMILSSSSSSQLPSSESPSLIQPLTLSGINGMERSPKGNSVIKTDSESASTRVNDVHFTLGRSSHRISPPALSDLPPPSPSSTGLSFILDAPLQSQGVGSETCGKSIRKEGSSSSSTKRTDEEILGLAGGEGRVMEREKEKEDMEMDYEEPIVVEDTMGKLRKSPKVTSEELFPLDEIEDTTVTSAYKGYPSYPPGLPKNPTRAPEGDGWQSANSMPSYMGRKRAPSIEPEIPDAVVRARSPSPRRGRSRAVHPLIGHVTPSRPSQGSNVRGSRNRSHLENHPSSSPSSYSPHPTGLVNEHRTPIFMKRSAFQQRSILEHEAGRPPRPPSPTAPPRRHSPPPRARSRSNSRWLHMTESSYRPNAWGPRGASKGPEARGEGEHKRARREMGSHSPHHRFPEGQGRGVNWGRQASRERRPSRGCHYHDRSVSRSRQPDPEPTVHFVGTPRGRMDRPVDAGAIEPSTRVGSMGTGEIPYTPVETLGPPETFELLRSTLPALQCECPRHGCNRGSLMDIIWQQQWQILNQQYALMKQPHPPWPSHASRPSRSPGPGGHARSRSRVRR